MNTEYNNNIHSQEDDMLALRDLFIKWIHHWHWFLISFLIVGVVTAYYLRRTIPEYNVSATILIKDAKKGVGMFQMDAINIPVLGIIENMSYFCPEELPNNKYYLFGRDGAKNLANDINVPFLGGLPINQSIREASDVGRPAALQTNSEVPKEFEEIVKNTLLSLTERVKSLPPAEAVRITTMAGCKTTKREV